MKNDKWSQETHLRGLVETKTSRLTEAHRNTRAEGKTYYWFCLKGISNTTF